MKIPRLGVKAELQPRAYITATDTATPDLSHVCDLCLSLWQCLSLTECVRPGIKPASLWIPVRFLTRLATRGTPDGLFFTKNIFKDITLQGVGEDAGLSGGFTNKPGDGCPHNSLSRHTKFLPQQSAKVIGHDSPCHFSQVKAWMLSAQ